MATNKSENGSPRKSVAKKATAAKKAAVKKTAAKAAASTTTAVAVTKAATKKASANKAAPKPPTKKAPAQTGSSAEKLAAAARPARGKKATGSIAQTARETQVVARIDVGFGNTLYIRGNGPGLSWDTGVAMQNTGPNEWIWSSRDASSEFEVKLLINDETWETGPNTTVLAAEKCVIEPVF